MTAARIVNLCFCIAMAPAAAAAQTVGTRQFVVQTGVTSPGGAPAGQEGHVQLDTTRLEPDINGRWQPIETRSVDIRQVGPSERREEETIQRPGPYGTLALSEHRVTVRTTSAAGETVLIERYTIDGEGYVRDDGRLSLRDRVRVTTTPTAEGGRQTVEEVEGRMLSAPYDPMRILRRSVETVRQISPGRWVTERQIFELDMNKMLVPVKSELVENTEK